MRKNHCRGGACSTGMYPWGSSLSFTTVFDEGIFERGKDSRKRFFGQRLPSVKNCYRERIWVIKTMVWMFKKRNGHKSLRTSCSNSLVFYST